MTRKLEAIRDSRVTDTELGELRESKGAALLAVAEAAVTNAKSQHLQSEIQLMAVKAMTQHGKSIEMDQICLGCGLIYTRNEAQCPECSGNS